MQIIGSRLRWDRPHLVLVLLEMKRIIRIVEDGYSGDDNENDEEVEVVMMMMVMMVMTMMMMIIMMMRPCER